MISADHDERGTLNTDDTAPTASVGRGAAQTDKVILKGCAVEGVKVGTNCDEQWVIEGYSSVVTISTTGEVFGYDFPQTRTAADGHRFVGARLQLSSPPIGVDVDVKWILHLGPWIAVVARDGRVFGNDWLGDNKIGPTYELDGPSVGTNAGARWTVHHGTNRILVIADDGTVTAHDVRGHTISDAQQLVGQSVGTFAHALVMADTLLTVTSGGHVFGHDLSTAQHPSGRAIGPGDRVSGPPVGGTDTKWIIPDLADILVIANDGTMTAFPTRGFVPV